MQDTIKALQEERNALASQIQEMASRQESWTAEDAQTWDQVNERYDTLEEDLTAKLERQKVLDKAAQVAEFDDQVRSISSTTVGAARVERAGLITNETRALALQGWLRAANDLDLDSRHADAIKQCGLRVGGKFLEVSLPPVVALRGYSAWDVKAGASLAEFEKVFKDYTGRSLSVGTPADGGYTVPEGFSYELERVLLSFGGPRRVARIYPTASGNPLPWPVVDDTANEGEIIAEEGDIGASVDPTFSQVMFGAFKYSSKPILVTAELLEDSAFNMAQLVAELLGERIGRKQATDFTVGAGTTEPTGMVTASNKGADAASATSIDADELIDLQYALDDGYEMMPSVGWMMNKKTKAAVRKLKDGTTGVFLWQPSFQAGEPDLILGRPVQTNQAMPDIASNAKSVLYGAFEKYVIRDAASVRFYRLEELYRANDHTGFIAFRRSDGQCLNPAAILHLLHPA